MEVLEIVLWLSVLPLVLAYVKFTNIKCIPLDPSMMKFEYCFMKVVNRTTSYISVKANLWQLPITNATIEIQTFKRANGYKPFLYKFAVDACKFLREKRNPLHRYFFDLFTAYSNINHTCPYEDDIFLEKLPNNFVDVQITNRLPVPKGDYYINTTWCTFNVRRAFVAVYISLS